ncbi:MAG: beta-galactosidase trimerization domain-containing protein [Terrimicrobiaceae bacterium]|nr:beta-galactosidase trimerization domain-containing protein [Terrimicrobiaceae bacterium]
MSGRTGFPAHAATPLRLIDTGRTRCPTFLVLFLVLAAGLQTQKADDGGSPWKVAYATDTPATQTLRGYGRVGTTSSAFDSSAGERAWAWTFRCENQEKASAVIGKFLSDLKLSEGLKVETLQVAGKTVPLNVTSNGSAFVGCVDGAEGRIVCSENQKALQAFAESHPAMVSGAVASARYPLYLDRFDRYGWGSYGVGGFDSPDGPDKTASAGKKTGIDPTEDVQFLIDNRIRSDLFIDPTEFDFGDGLMKDTQWEWISKMLSDAGQPFSLRVYGPPGGSNWTDRRFPEYVEQPASFLQSGWHGPIQFYTAQKHFSWFQPDIQRYIAAETMANMRKVTDNPFLMGWMHPQGELSHDPWFDMHDDYSPAAQRSWRDYLQKHGVTLGEATRMYGLQDKPFADWEQVTIPEFATFEGLSQQVVSLDGTWNYRVDIPPKTVLDDAWYSKSPGDRYPGVRGQWYKAPMRPGEWQSMRLPGNDGIYGLFHDLELGSAGHDSMSTWFRRSFTLTPAQAASPRLFLYFFPISNAGIHTGPKGRFHEIYLNGEKAGEIGGWGAIDVTKWVRPGENQIALHLLGARWNGRMYLSTQPPRIFPYFGGEMNQLWTMWKDWHLDSKYLAWRDILDGMRQVDPNRPIKFMAPSGMGTDRYLQLAADYGGFPHFTGEGGWFFPWYKRYAFLYDVPGTSETAGPARNVADQFESFRRTFLAGLNAHDPVFLIQTYTRNEGLRKFWLEHGPVLKQMGRFDLDPGQQVLLFRSTQGESGLLQDAPYPPVGASKEVQSPWNWDFGRGTMQTLGQSYLYLDEGGVRDGKMNGYPLMIDDGNEVVSPAALQGIAEWVKAGGTFVTLPFTGRSTFSQPDSWPIRQLTGCEIGRLRAPGQGRITFNAKQSLFKSFAGKTMDDNGHSADWQGGEHNLLSIELKPGADSEVLATFENGAPAIVRRKLGKGSVIALGTAFWRDAKDVHGLWKPGPCEVDFMTDLLGGVGFPAARCTTDDLLVWAQPYRYNNGLEASTTLVSWHDDAGVTVTLAMRLPRKPARLAAFGVEGEKHLPFTWADGVATTKVFLPAKEVKVVTADVYDPNEAVAHWWTYQQRMWHGLAKPTIDFGPYTKGKFADPTLDLREGAQLAIGQPAGEDWTKAGFLAGSWKPCILGLLNTYGAQPNKPAYVRKTFTVPEAWLNRGGRIYMTSGAWSGPHYLGAARMALNGKMLHDFTKDSFNEFDVTDLVTGGENVLSFTFKGDNKYQGFAGNVWLYYATPAERSLNLAGIWNGMENGSPATLALPGQGRLKMPSRTVFIPKEWEGRYQVRLYMEGASRSILGAWVNDRLVRRHHHSLGSRCDIDITSQLKFGQENELILANGGDYNGVNLDPKASFDWDIKVIRLDLYPAK